MPAAACAALTYDVSIAGSTAPPTAKVYGLAEPSWALPALAPGTYAWQVLVHDANGGETRGPEWHFTQRAAPSAGATTSPPSLPPVRAGEDAATIGTAILAFLVCVVLLGILWRMRRPGSR